MPQHVQNIIIKDFCNKNKLNFLLSATEYSMKESSHIINELVDNIDNLYGIVAIVFFNYYSDKKIRKKILNKILIKNFSLLVKICKFQIELKCLKLKHYGISKKYQRAINYDRIYKNKNINEFKFNFKITQFY